ncbi:MAG: bifunctional precorrin-2 dehydrogenase/sirohydrochlorin ferrochelatase [Sulfurimonas sp.]|uniref:precorrin-2 dehydrogenase/sirohydrochlorin ferrochelatase family protein n=1 Tax=Sulfurimonas sp. TaxID=2022749 RepID=UPI0026039DC5|nr:bifunctional precorrin-2 dehydrogenase/sirohydrochlorin ferrochelatase [Sulfurimonas sp.]MDD2653058.1 bifunctional precorrin-2 dehydrogenase/sirohydrochlorin ferrochelatase [Sulfurimonas sp.]MDD3452249.1 bifunctional precorrin-2 dehydrogenase/sirohydrochlorin ferrochelatase [Sulfurimonas sp.]
MSYFPAFLQLQNRKILLVGGGLVASSKLRHLLDFTTNISVIAPVLSDETEYLVEANNLYLKKRGYKKGDIQGFDIVVVAVDNIGLQAEIFKESRGYNCLCNCVDAAEYCDFIFGSIIKKDDLTIAISTSGASPAVAKQLKQYLEKLIPHDIGTFLKEMKNLRESLPKGKERMKMLEEKAKNYIQKWSN